MPFIKFQPCDNTLFGVLYGRLFNLILVLCLQMDFCLMY